MSRRLQALMGAVLVVGVLVVPGCAPTEPAEQPEPAEEAFTPPEDALVSASAESTPTLDGVGDDAVWEEATETVITVTGGANESATDVAMKSVYTDDSVSFLVTWKDPTESWMRAPWEKQANGTWKQLADPNDKGGDNNLYYEDKIAIIWPIDNSIEDFDQQGCNVTCHSGEDSDIKPYGNKYTNGPGQLGDIWHWKSVRNVGQVDDQYLDDAKIDRNKLEETKDAGRHSDPNDGGGYTDNKTEDGKLPAFMQPGGGQKDGSPGFILDSEKVEFDDSVFKAKDRVPGIVVAPWQGDRANISAAWEYADGTWTLEFTRALETGSENDVQFGDANATYYFGLATFDNAQVRHATSGQPTPFVFKP